MNADVKTRMDAPSAEDGDSLFQAFFEDSPIGLCMLDSEGRFLRVNRAFAELLGYSPSSLQRLTFQDLTHPDHMAEMGECHRRLRAGEIAKCDMEKRCRAADGRWVWVRAAISAQRNREGAVTHFLANVFDISERKAAEERLNALTAAVEQSPASVLVADRDGRIVYVNGQFTRITGYAAEEVRGQTPRVLKSGNTQDQTYRDLWSTITAGGTWHGELQNRKKNGELFWNAVSISPVRNAAGEVVNFVGVQDNITERRRAVEALAASEERFRQVAENIREAFYLVDLRARETVYVSRMWEEIWGRPALEFYQDANAWIQAIHEADRHEIDGLFERLASGESHLATFRIRLPGGAVRWVKNRAFPIRDASGSVYRFVGVAEDITELKDVERQLGHAQKMEAVGRLAGGVAHDFNNILTVVNSNAEFLLQDLATHDPRRAEVQEISDAGKRAADLTRQLLLFSRQQVLQPRVLDLNEVIANLQKMLRRLIGEDVTLTTRLDPQAGRVRVDPGQIEQVLMNLCVNARDAMPDGGVLTIETSGVPEGARECSAPVAGPHVRLVVRDTGTGMSADVLAHIFEPFFTTKDKGKGTGLGLATVYAVIKDSRGTIDVESNPGAGTAFTICLPTVTEQLDLESAVSGAVSFEGTETILVAEDEASVRNVVRRVLTRNGYVVIECDNAASALRALEANPGTSLLLTDVIMPDQSGRLLAERCQAAKPNLRVLYMSGYTDGEIVRHGILEPGVAFIQKPFPPNALLKRVREVLDA